MTSSQTSVSLQFNPQFPAVTHLSQSRFLSVRSTWSAESFIRFFKLIRICFRFLSFRIKTLRNEWPISLIFTIKLCRNKQRLCHATAFDKHCGQANQHLTRHLPCVYEALQEMLSTTAERDRSVFLLNLLHSVIVKLLMVYSSEQWICLLKWNKTFLSKFGSNMLVTFISHIIGKIPGIAQ